MIRTTWTIRMGILGAIVSVAVLASATATTSAAQGSLAKVFQGSGTVSGVHANEPFCQTQLRQIELFGEYAKLNQINPDMAKRTKYFTDSKALNVTLVKTAPVSLASDVARATKNSDAGLDAQIANSSKAILASAEVARSPEYLAIGRRMGEYCGVKF